MTRDQLIQRLRKLARKTGTDFEVERNRGKGSHYRVRFGDRVTTVQNDLNPGRIARILKQLNIDPAAL